jgi:ribosomal protein L3
VRDADGLGVKVGESVGAAWFQVGQWVDVRGISRGMGFAGVSLSSSALCRTRQARPIEP